MAGSEGRPGRGRAGLVVPLLAAAPLVAALLVARAGGGVAPDPGATSSTTTTEPGPVRTAPVGPGADPALAGGGDIALDFAIDALTMPSPVPGRAWEPVRGDWSVIDGRVVGVDDGTSGALATVDVDTRELRIEVALPDATDSTGLAFSVQNDGYLRWGPSAGYPSIGLYRVSGGEAELLLHSGTTTLGKGMRIGLRLDGDQVELLAGGAVVGTYDDPSSSTVLGLAAGPGAVLGTFDDLVLDRDGVP